MRGKRIDCEKPKDNGSGQCVNRGRLVKYTYQGKLVHQGFRYRLWPDPRKKEKAK